jgi:hypothetical protein
LSGWSKLCKFAHALQWEYSHRRLKLALGQLGVFLTNLVGVRGDQRGVARAVGDDSEAPDLVGFGRIVASGLEVRNMLVNMV